DYVEVDRVLEVSYCEDKDTGEVRVGGLFHSQQMTSNGEMISLPFVGKRERQSVYVCTLCVCVCP
ncbi:unnamed protein product, partial [Oncorhynchus mykiss]